MTYKVILHNGIEALRQEPEMGAPLFDYGFPPDGSSDSMLKSAEQDYEKRCSEYNQHLAECSKNIIPIAPEYQDKWEVGQSVEDSEFGIRCGIHPCHCKDVEKCEHPLAIVPKSKQINIMRQAKFNGKTYEVKPTGKTIKKGGKHYVDMNGYDVYDTVRKTKQLGMYDEKGVLHFTITEDGRIYNGTEFFGSTVIKEVSISDEPKHHFKIESMPKEKFAIPKPLLEEEKEEEEALWEEAFKEAEKAYIPTFIHRQTQLFHYLKQHYHITKK